MSYLIIHLFVSHLLLHLTVKETEWSSESLGDLPQVIISWEVNLSIRCWEFSAETSRSGQRQGFQERASASRSRGARLSRKCLGEVSFLSRNQENLGTESALGDSRGLVAYSRCSMFTNYSEHCSRVKRGGEAMFKKKRKKKKAMCSLTHIHYILVFLDCRSRVGLGGGVSIGAAVGRFEWMSV